MQYAGLLRLLIRQVAAPGNHAHAKGARIRGDARADTAEADDSHGLALERASELNAGLKAIVAHSGIAGRDLARCRKHETQRQLRRSGGRGGPGAAADDAVLG